MSPAYVVKHGALYLLAEMWRIPGQDPWTRSRADRAVYTDREHAFREQRAFGGKVFAIRRSVPQHALFSLLLPHEKRVLVDLAHAFVTARSCVVPERFRNELTLTEAAQRIGVCKSTICLAAHSGKIRYRTIGKRMILDAESVDAYVVDRRLSTSVKRALRRRRAAEARA